jgi:hypothetical protein
MNFIKIKQVKMDTIMIVENVLLLKEKHIEKNILKNMKKETM